MTDSKPHMFAVFHRSNFDPAETLVAVATTMEGADAEASRDRQRKIAQNLNWDEAEFLEDWREELVKKGVPEELVGDLRPQPDLVLAEERSAREEAISTHRWRIGTVRVVY